MAPGPDAVAAEPGPDRNSTDPASVISTFLLRCVREPEPVKT